MHEAIYPRAPSGGAAIARACPGFRATAAPRIATKSVLVRGEVDGVPAVAKLLRRPDPHGAWAYYLANETAVLAALEARPAPLTAPRLLGHADGVVVRTWLEAPPVATLRDPRATLGAALPPLLASLDALAAHAGPHAAPPSPAQHRALRASLLEEPADPTWCRAALERAEAHGLVPAGTAAHLGPPLDALPTAFAHGDLLLRNVLEDGALIDWECAGHHPAGWDLALLSTQLAPDEASVVEARLAAPQRALVVVALAREVWFHRRHPDTRAARRRADQLAAAIDRIA